MMPAFLLALIILFAFVFTAALADSPTVIYSGECGSEAVWTLDSEGTLIISGSGRMTNYKTAGAVPWYLERETIKKVVVEPGIERIGDYAFDACAVTEVNLPDGLVTIERYAFYGCDKLTELNIPDSVTSIGNYASGTAPL